MHVRRAALLFFALVIAATASGQDQSVTRVGLVAKPTRYRGPCPATMHFIGSIHVSRYPVVVEYQWERSDGQTGPRQRVTVSTPSQDVHDTWTLGVEGAQADVWERLHVVAPTGVESALASVHLGCR